MVNAAKDGCLTGNSGHALVINLPNIYLISYPFKILCLQSFLTVQGFIQTLLPICWLLFR